VSVGSAAELMDAFYKMVFRVKSVSARLQHLFTVLHKVLAIGILLLARAIMYLRKLSIRKNDLKEKQ
jgi:hypothetical protein